MKNTIIKIGLILSFGFFTFGCATTQSAHEKSQISYSYSQLRTADLDQMTELLQRKSKEYLKTEKPEALQEGLLICLSRPNEDGLIEKVISIVRTPMEDHDLWETSVEALVDESITVLRNENANGVDQVTYGFVLENLVSEFKPQYVKQYQSPGFETKIIEKIADADIQYTKQALAERKLNVMRGQISPSLFAKKLEEKKEAFLKAQSKK